MKLFISAILFSSALLSQTKALGDEPRFSNSLPSIERGRYVAKVSGCNDCHTPMYLVQNGNVPEKDWLIGVALGWKGPWGTTYAANVRQRVAAMTEDQWVVYLKTLNARPPMPFFNVNALKEIDSRSLYRFIRYLGNNSQAIPAALPPGEKPTTAYINFDVIMP